MKTQCLYDKLIMEIDPHYIDVIIARFEKFSGKKAEIINASR